MSNFSLNVIQGFGRIVQQFISASFCINIEIELHFKIKWSLCNDTAEQYIITIINITPCYITIYLIPWMYLKKCTATLVPEVVAVRVMQLKPLWGNKENRQKDSFFFFLFHLQREVRGLDWLQTKSLELVGNPVCFFRAVQLLANTETLTPGWKTFFSNQLDRLASKPLWLLFDLVCSAPLCGLLLWMRSLVHGPQRADELSDIYLIENVMIL